MHPRGDKIGLPGERAISRLNICVEGWRGINHSYALANQYQLRELLKRDDLRLFHIDAPFARRDWSPSRNPAGFTPAEQQAIDLIPPPGDAPIDCLYTIASPFKPPAPHSSRRAVTFMITETGLDKRAFYDVGDQVDAYTQGANLIQTSSGWSRDRLVDWGFSRESVVVIPLGVDAETFAPMSVEDRAMSRGTLNVRPDETLFFAVAAPFHNKGLDLLLRAFAVLVQRGRNVRLIVKDQKDVYGLSAEEIVAGLAPHYPGLFSEAVIARLSYVHGNISRDILRILYCAADCVVSSYRAEGFNLPVLEAIACGTPVVVTEGGATDDFVTPRVGVKVPGAFRRVENAETRLVGAFIEPDFDALVESMDRFATGASPLPAGHLEASRAVAARFNWSATAAALVDTLRHGIVARAA